MPPGEEYVFARGSNVLDYWLAHAEGFVVCAGGRPVGVVRHVAIDPATGLARELVLRSTLLRRRRVVAAREFEVVVPAQRRLELPARVSRWPARRATLKRWSARVDARFEAAGSWLRPRLRASAVAVAARVRRYAHDAYSRGRARGVRRAPRRARGG